MKKFPIIRGGLFWQNASSSRDTITPWSDSCATLRRRFLPLILAALISAPSIGAAESLRWKIQCLGVDSNEGVDIADFNNDGRLDVIAGRSWYAAPDYTPRPVRSIEDWNGYVESNGDFAYDVNQDGRMDVIAGSFLPTVVHWYENPGGEALKMGKLWKQHQLVDTGASQNEGQLMHDLDGDGVPEWVVNSWAKSVPTVAWKLGKTEQGQATMEKLLIGAKLNGHGLGFGDLNGDGREDILFEAGWYERPQGDPFHVAWTFHPQWSIHASVPMLVRDMDRDGRNDILLGIGHGYGLYWYRQTAPAEDGQLRFDKHLIDGSFSQPHALHFADLDGDGVDELITGKRVYAHNGNDPGGKEPPCIYYFTWDIKALKFSRHTIDEGRVGIGLQIRTADLNNDGRLDIAVAGKSGTYILFNQGF